MKKNIYLFLFMIFLVVAKTHAGEFTGAGKIVADVLAQNQISLSDMIRSGHDLAVAGEFTGAGRNIQFGKVVLMVTKDEVISPRDIDLVQTTRGDFRPPPQAQALSEMQRFEAFGRLYEKASVKGVIFKK